VMPTTSARSFRAFEHMRRAQTERGVCGRHEKRAPVELSAEFPALASTRDEPRRTAHATLAEQMAES